jgi:DNA uptake protein ComE-like DNA-binding protein
MAAGGGELMIVFDWLELATDSVIDRLHATLGISSPADHSEDMRRTLARLYALVGGLNVSRESVATLNRDALAFELIENACEHTLGLLRAAETTPGYVTSARETDLPFSIRASAQDVIAVNNATRTLLDGLPGIGPVTAGRIIDARHSGGWFRSAEELDERVEGIGPGALRDIARAVSYRAPELFGLDHARDLDERLRLVRSLSGSAAPLMAVLELLIAVCARDPHPYTVQHRQRPNTTFNPGLSAAQWIAVLANQDYQPGVRAIFDSAVQSIDVCMFHIALGGPEHPTRALIDSLIAANERGIAVRVIVDRDRPTDPYLSTVINTPARDFLNARGVSVRWDPLQRLLHSKFLVVDARVAVIGSHNWSAGSFFDYDDVSLAIEASGLVDALLARFNALWAISEGP